MNQTDPRAAIAALLSAQPNDALASYFALEHDPRRTRLTLRFDARGQAVALIAVCQTGIDLFRPLVVARGDDSAAVRDALREALTRSRQYLFSIPPALRPDLESVAHLTGEAMNSLYTLTPGQFKPVVNILVQTSKTPDGQLRATIRSRDGDAAAESGTTWISSRYAEIFVNVAEPFRRRGLGKSVVSAVSNQVLELKRQPLYVAAQQNAASQRLALRLGYQDTGAVELTGACTKRDG